MYDGVEAVPYYFIALASEQSKCLLSGTRAGVIKNERGALPHSVRDRIQALLGK